MKVALCCSELLLVAVYCTTFFFYLTFKHMGCRSFFDVWFAKIVGVLATNIKEK